MKNIQSEHAAWAERKFPGYTIEDLSAKLSEEAGEVAKCVQAMKWNLPTRETLLDEVGDCGIVLAGIAHKLGCDLAEVIETRWGIVKRR